jgi:hypothetical protein
MKLPDLYSLKLTGRTAEFDTTSAEWCGKEKNILSKVNMTLSGNSPGAPQPPIERPGATAVHEGMGRTGPTAVHEAERESTASVRKRRSYQGLSLSVCCAVLPRLTVPITLSAVT